MKVAIIGSRSLEVDISEYIPMETTEIISGGAKGIGMIAEAYVDKNNISEQIVKPEYNKYGNAHL